MMMEHELDFQSAMNNSRFQNRCIQGKVKKYLQNKQKRRNEMRFVVILKQIPDDSIKDEYQDVDQLNDSDKNLFL